MKIPFVNVWISRKPPAQITLHNAKVQLVREQSSAKTVERPVATQAFKRLQSLYLHGMKAGRTPRNKREHVNKVVAAAHDDVKTYYGIKVAK